MPKILVIEDDRFFAEDFIYFLEKSGYECDYAPDADTALEFIKNIDSYGQVTMDLMMHKGTKLADAPHDESTGVALFSEIRKRNENIPILVITAKSMPEIAEIILNDDNTNVLNKPVTDIKGMIEERIL